MPLARFHVPFEPVSKTPLPRPLSTEMLAGDSIANASGNILRTSRARTAVLKFAKRRTACLCRRRRSCSVSSASGRQRRGSSERFRFGRSMPNDFERETSSLSLRLRFRTDRDGAPAFGSCSAVVRQLSGSCPRFFFGQEKSGFEPGPVVRRQNPASES